MTKKLLLFAFMLFCSFKPLLAEIPGNVNLAISMQNTATTSLKFDFDVNTFRYVSFGGGGMTNLGLDSKTLHLDLFNNNIYLQSKFHFVPIEKEYTYKWDPYLGVNLGFYGHHKITDIKEKLIIRNENYDWFWGIHIGNKVYIYENLGISAECTLFDYGIFYSLGLCYRL